MTKFRFIAIAAMAIAAIVSCTPKTALKWEEGETNAETGRATHTLTIANAPEGDAWRLWFTSLYRMRGLTVEEGSPATIEYHGG